MVLAFVYLLLLCGMLASEVALFGFRTAGLVGAALFLACAFVLAVRPVARH